MTDDGMVDLYIDGHWVGRVDKERFEREWAAAQPVRDLIQRDVEQALKELGE